LCDEPSLGLAPQRVAEMFATLDRIRRAGVTVLLADQNANAALRLADRAYVLETGRVLFTGPSSELANDSRLTHAYIGTAPANSRGL
jgi:branched-chain amino acid transport system ATP-binding protein